MDYELVIYDRAKQDIIDSFDWYENKIAGLGNRFIDEVERELNYIKSFPEHYQIKYKSTYRQAVLRKFPYLIIYEVLKRKVVILSVFPARENPKKKP